MKIRAKELSYLFKSPRKIHWKVVAGPPLENIQMYDLVYDRHDFQIRNVEYAPRIPL